MYSSTCRLPKKIKMIGQSVDWHLGNSCTRTHVRRPNGRLLIKLGAYSSHSFSESGVLRRLDSLQERLLAQEKEI